MKKVLLLSTCSLALAAIGPTARAGSLTDPDAIRAIVGEAADCPFTVQLGIAATLRHRSWVMARPLHGVYGWHARHNAGEKPAVWVSARLAWSQSVTNDPARQALYFGNRQDVEKGTFLGLTQTAVLGTGKHATYFFKP